MEKVLSKSQIEMITKAAKDAGFNPRRIEKTSGFIELSSFTTKGASIHINYDSEEIGDEMVLIGHSTHHDQTVSGAKQSVKNIQKGIKLVNKIKKIIEYY